jgi:hypothetical protein
MVDRVCEQCGKPFQVTIAKFNDGGGRFCSAKCSGLNRRKQIPCECPVCGLTFQRRPSQVRGGFCSPKCAGRALAAKPKEQQINWKGGPQMVSCQQCGRDFPVHRCQIGKVRFCSVECSAVARSGENSRWWAGGKSFEPYPPTFNARFKRMIRERDDYRCALCGKLNSKEVHHINYVKADTNPDNCITLCRSCHSKTTNRRAWAQPLCQEIMTLRLWSLRNAA